MYMKVFGHQTTTDISPGRNVPNITMRNGDFSTKKNPFRNKKFWLKFLYNMLIILKHF